METKGIEPSTPALQRLEPPIASDTDNGHTVNDLSVCSSVCSNFDDLVKIVTAWPHPPEAIRRAMLALVG